MLVYAAIGDAYGAAFEFLDYARWPKNDGQHYYRQPDTGLGDGKYTDDTQMLAGVVDVMLKSGRHATPLEFANKWHDQYNRDPRAGYAMGFKNLLESTENGEELIEKLIPKSSRSGAVMRAAVVGGLNNVHDVLDMAKRQAIITHDTPIAIECAQAVALLAHFMIHKRGPRDQARGFVNDVLAGTRTVDWTEDRNDWATVEAVDCARNAVTAWYKSSTVTEVLVNSVAPGGDTDTVATIAMALAWADPTIRDDLHVNMLNDLETGVYGFEYLFDLNHRFVERFCK
ncbi:ADP-ribosylglycohydrolase [compost metagenome]